jgi:chromosome segregation ATPase
MEMLFI